jgi:hypothetical protein
MFGFSIGASKIDLGEFTESNGHVCDDAISVLGGSGLVVVKCLVFEDLPVSVRVYWRRTSRTRKGILTTIKFQLMPVNFQIHYYYLHSYTISENGSNKIYF